MNEIVWVTFMFVDTCALAVLLFIINIRIEWMRNKLNT